MKRIHLLSIFVFLFCFIRVEANNFLKEYKDSAILKGGLLNEKRDSLETDKDSISVYDDFFKEKHKTVKGMFTIHKMKDKIYFEIPLSMMGKQMLMASTVTSTSDNGNGIVGSKSDPIHITFTKSGNNVQIRKISCDVITDREDSPIAGAIERSNVGSVIHNMKVQTYSKDSSSVVVDITGFLVSDNKDLSPFDKYSQYTSFNGLKRDENFQQDKSYAGDIKAFSDNVVVTSTLSYNYTLTNQQSNKVMVKNQPFSAVVSRSIILLKDIPSKPRIADYRVAVFNTGKYMFGETEQASKRVYYANRWNIEPKDEEAYKAGELVEPKKPIIFYIDSNLPSVWKPYIKEGVEQWNELFEMIGFKNVVKAMDFPKDDPEFDPDNIKYSCVRYAPIGIQNAMGPSWVDPRSGEIINASVYVYHDIIKLLNNWMFVQISPIDKRIRTKNIPEEIIGDGLRYVISHEIGHCLGFMHNMSASNVIPVDSLRSPTFTNKNGTTTSIMDYARFNYVAQPGDMEKGVKLTPPRFGEYDKFLIKWNYTYFPRTNSVQEGEILSDLVSMAIKNPVYRYGKQLSYIIDPRSQTEDLGDNAIKASEYGIKNLKYLMKYYNDWVANQDDDFTYRSEIYDAIVLQYIRYINHVFSYVGGIYLNEVKIGDGIIPFESVERKKQKAALKFIMEQIDDSDWLDNKRLMKNLTIMVSAKELVQSVLAKAIISSPSKVMLSSSISKDPYDFFNCSDDVYEFIWGKSKIKRPLTPIQRFMQSEYVKGIIDAGNISKVVSSNGINVFDILSNEDKSGKFSNLIRSHKMLEFTNEDIFSKLNKPGNSNVPYGLFPVAGYGSISTKFNIAFNVESDFYCYLIRVRNLLVELSTSSVNKYDKLHYDLLLKKINHAIKVD